MQKAANFFTGLVAVIHVYIMVLESFLWNTAYGHKTFHLTPEKAEMTITMAQNQGFYNGILAAGLVWSFLIKDQVWRKNVAMFFLGAVFACGIVGAATAMVKILFIQSVPAGLGLLFVYLANKDPK